MIKAEILSHIHVGRSRSVCVDCSLSENYLGWVRTITIESETELQVEFDVYGYDEGGLYVTIEYSDIDTLINQLEIYFNLKLEQWENFTKSGKYPELKDKVDFEKSGNQLKRDLVDKRLSLPNRGIRYTIKSTYWKNIAEGKIEIETRKAYTFD
jgi:hypothetical protein